MDPRDALCQYAEETNADAMVLGNRGLGAFKRYSSSRLQGGVTHFGRLILGSVSDACVRLAKCAVVVYKRHEEV